MRWYHGIGAKLHKNCGDLFSSFESRRYDCLKVGGQNATEFRWRPSQAGNFVSNSTDIIRIPASFLFFPMTRIRRFWRDRKYLAIFVRFKTQNERHVGHTVIIPNEFVLNTATNNNQFVSVPFDYGYLGRPLNYSWHENE